MALTSSQYTLPQYLLLCLQSSDAGVNDSNEEGTSKVTVEEKVFLHNAFCACVVSLQLTPYKKK